MASSQNAQGALNVHSVAFGSASPDLVCFNERFIIKVVGEDLVFEWAYLGEVDRVKIKVAECSSVEWCTTFPGILISVAPTCEPRVGELLPMFWEPKKGGHGALIMVYLRTWSEQEFNSFKQAMASVAPVLFEEIDIAQMQLRISHLPFKTPGRVPLSGSVAGPLTPVGVLPGWKPAAA